VSPDDLSFSLKPESMTYAGDSSEIRREHAEKSDHLYKEIIKHKIHENILKIF